MYNDDKELKKNGSGYYDPTAWRAIQEMLLEERHAKTIHTIFHICELAGFKVEDRIVLRDRKTGRVFE